MLRELEDTCYFDSTVIEDIVRLTACDVHKAPNPALAWMFLASQIQPDLTARADIKRMAVVFDADACAIEVCLEQLVRIGFVERLGLSRVYRVRGAIPCTSFEEGDLQ